MNDIITLNLKQSAQLIRAVPGNRVLLQGEPGIGKSSLIKMLEEMTGYKGYYVDCPNLDVGDATCPIPVNETKTLEYFVNSNFGLHEGKPVILMLDEYTKASEGVQNTLHPLLESHNPRLGNLKLHPDSLVFMTGNLSGEGLGDFIKAHTKMRITVVNVRKPNAEEWMPWAAENNIHPVVMAWVHRNPQVLASYLDGDLRGNPYPYNPKITGQGSVVTPRTLERSSNIVHQRHQIDDQTLTASLQGTMGAPGASGLSSFIRHQDSLPAWEDVISHPKETRVPEEPGACAVLTYGALERVTKENIDAWMTYMERMDVEWQCIFNITLSKSKKQAVGFHSRKFAEWVRSNSDIL